MEFVEDEGLDHLGPVGAALGLMKDTAENMHTYEEATEARATFQEQIRRIDTMIQNYDAKMSPSESRLEAMQKFIEGIDQYCQAKAAKKQCQSPSQAAVPPPR